MRAEHADAGSIQHNDTDEPEGETARGNKDILPCCLKSIVGALQPHKQSGRDRGRFKDHPQPGYVRNRRNNRFGARKSIGQGQKLPAIALVVRVADVFNTHIPRDVETDRAIDDRDRKEEERRHPIDVTAAAMRHDERFDEDRRRRAQPGDSGKHTSDARWHEERNHCRRGGNSNNDGYEHIHPRKF